MPRSPRRAFLLAAVIVATVSLVAAAAFAAEPPREPVRCRCSSQRHELRRLARAACEPGRGFRDLVLDIIDSRTFRTR